MFIVGKRSSISALRQECHVARRVNGFACDGLSLLEHSTPKGVQQILLIPKL
jgi:hypothetical protein